MLRVALYMAITIIAAFCSYDGWFAWDRGYSPIYLIPMYGLAALAVFWLAKAAHRPKDITHA